MNGDDRVALVNCPECDKLVSEFAATCPNCGFSVREHFEELAAKQKAIDEFNKTHQTLEPNDDDWYKLFSAYDGAVKHLAEITKRLSKYRNVFFDGTSSISGIGFTNGWFGCIHDGYDEIIKQLKQMLGDFSNKVIVSNLNELEQYSQNLSTVRAVLKRWGDLIDGPLCSNEPAVLREADRRYVKDIAENSSMGFGIITSSFTSAALYAVSSSIKEVRAEMEAEKNKQKYMFLRLAVSFFLLIA